MKADFYTEPNEKKQNEPFTQDVGGEKPKTDDEDADA
jgi:hypothetical protein